MRKNRGLSLIELMFTVALVSILITIGVPGIQTLLTQNRIIANTNDISAIIRFARFTAVDEQRTVVLCPTTDYVQCGINWQLAKMVFIDDNGDGNRSNEEDLFQTTDPLPSTVFITGLHSALTFFADGSISSAVAITLCPEDANVTQASAVLTSLYGRVAIAVDADDNGVKEDTLGNDLICS